MNFHPDFLYRSFLKSIIDWVLAVIALIFLSPLFITVAFVIKLDSKGPVFFRQERLGKHGKVFRIFKFRSMYNSPVHYNEKKALADNDPRITRVGRFIRKTSIDEIPQILNILVGDMSFIGPRPPVTYFPKKIDEYNEIEYQRFLVKPGLSGLAQVRCREIHDWDINIIIDIEYVQHYSFLYDLKLFFKSLPVFFITNNIYSRE